MHRRRLHTGPWRRYAAAPLCRSRPAAGLPLSLLRKATVLIVSLIGVATAHETQQVSDEPPGCLAHDLWPLHKCRAPGTPLADPYTFEISLALGVETRRLVGVRFEALHVELTIAGVSRHLAVGGAFSSAVGHSTEGLNFEDLVGRFFVEARAGRFRVGGSVGTQLANYGDALAIGALAEARVSLEVVRDFLFVALGANVVEELFDTTAFEWQVGCLLGVRLHG